LGQRLDNYRPLRNFALALVIVTVGGLALTAFTPAACWWFHSVAGLSWELTGFSILPIQIATVIPGVWTLVCFQRAVLVNSRRTAPITGATLAEVSVIIITMMLTIWYLDLVGAVAAIIALVAGSLTSAVYQYPPFRRILRRQ
jgi:O-antigen/teichoic acid export membrane protein